MRSKAVIGLISWEETDSLPAAWLAEYSWSIPRILGQHSPARPLANGNCLFAYMIGRRRHNGWPYWGCLIAICTASIPFAILYKTHQFLPFLCTTLQKLDHQATHYRLHVTRTRSIVAADWAVVWSQTFDLRRRPVSDQKKNRSWSWSCRSGVVLLWNTVLSRSSS